MLIHLAIIILLIVSGMMLSLGKWSFLISGFNTMSKEEKATYDKVALCKFMGKFVFSLAFTNLLMLLGDFFAINLLFNIGMALFAISIVFALIYTNTGKRFKIKK